MISRKTIFPFVALLFFSIWYAAGPAVHAAMPKHYQEKKIFFDALSIVLNKYITPVSNWSLLEGAVKGLHILEDEKLVGIITSTDVMRVLLRAIGFGEGSARFAVLVEDRVGIIAEVSRILKDQQISIRSLVTWPEKDYSGIYQLVMRVASKDKDDAVSALSNQGFKVLTEYVHDLTPYLPDA